MLLKNVCWRKTCMLVKTKIFSRTYFSPTYRKVFTNILHQHTFEFLFKIFTNIQYFSPTYRIFFSNILHQHTFKFLSSPTYSFTNIQKILHQHTFFHQHISPTSPQSYSRYCEDYSHSLFEKTDKNRTKNSEAEIFKVTSLRQYAP